jgi:hypothetical protein
MKVSKILVMTAVMLAVTIACEQPTSIPASIVGKWGTSGVQIMEFTQDGRFILGGAAISMSMEYKYTASNGSGEYWNPSYPTVKVPFTYILKTNSLEFKISSLNMTYYLTRM